MVEIGTGDYRHMSAWRRLALPAIAIATIAAALSGCSTYRGVKYGEATPSAPAVAPRGIPYSLVKPEFLLTVTDATTGATTKTTATLGYTQIPDPSQSYSVRLSPGFLSTPNFKINFNQGGSLQSTTASTAEQVTPTISAIGSFIVAVAGVAGKLGAGAATANGAKATPVTDALSGLLPTCAAKWDYPYQSAALNAALGQSAPRSVGDAIKARIALYYSDDDSLSNGILYLTSEERDCFEEVRAANAKALSDKVKTYNTTPASTFVANTVFSGQIMATWPTGDLSPLTSSMVCPDLAKCLTAKDIKENNAQLALINIAKSTAPLDALLKHVIEMPPDQWRARYVGFAEAELTRVAHSELVAPGPTAAQQAAEDKYSAYLSLQRANAIGAHLLYVRSLPLQAYLDRVRSKSVQGGTAPASAEYSQYRAELDQINTQMDASRTATLAVLQPKTIPDPNYQNSPVCWLSDPFSDDAGKSVALAVATRAQVTAACHVKTFPDYVVGLTRQ